VVWFNRPLFDHGTLDIDNLFKLSVECFSKETHNKRYLFSLLCNVRLPITSIATITTNGDGHVEIIRRLVSTLACSKEKEDLTWAPCELKGALKT
jgi:hypothetical protein